MMLCRGGGGRQDRCIGGRMGKPRRQPPLSFIQFLKHVFETLVVNTFHPFDRWPACSRETPSDPGVLSGGRGLLCAGEPGSSWLASKH